MWAGGPGSGPWAQSQWPMQQAVYQNIPHEQVDWAALAQQWIQMRETTPNDPPPPPLPPPPPPDGRGMPTSLPRQISAYETPGNGNVHAPSHLPIKRENTAMSSALSVLENRESLNHSDNSNSQDGSTFGQNSDWPGYWQSSSNSNPLWTNTGSNWAPPPPPPPSHPSDSKDGVQTFEYGHMHGNQGYAAQTYDYNHGSDQFNFNQNEAAPQEQSSFNQYWMQGGPPPFLRRDRKDDRFSREHSPPVDEDENSTSTLDAAKRKTLPAWIREGLEKMDREKMKKAEHETMMREREERLKLQREREERVMREEMAGAPVIPRKSKFDSDSDNDSDGSTGRGSPLFPKGNRLSPIRQRTPSPIEAPKTEQERLEFMMQKVRQMLTEILLQVTSEEIEHIVKETYAQAQAKAPALQLAKSSALASIVGSLGGLGGYGSDSAESESENEDLQHPQKPMSSRIREIVDYVPSDVSEDDGGESRERRESATKDAPSTNLYSTLGMPSPKVEARGDKYHFEKKYGEIPGLDVPTEADGGETTAATAAESGDKKAAKHDESSRSASSSSTSSSSSTDSSDSDPKQRKKVQERGKGADGEEGIDAKGSIGKSKSRDKRSRSRDKRSRSRDKRSRSRDKRSRSRDKRSRSRDKRSRSRDKRSRSRERGTQGSIRSRERRSRDRSRERRSRDRSSRERNRCRERQRRRSGEKKGKRSNSQSSSSSTERGGQRGIYRRGYGSQRRRRSWSRGGRPRRRSASPSRSRSRSPKRSSWRKRSRFSRSSSTGSSDQQKMGKKSSRKPRT